MPQAGNLRHPHYPRACLKIHSRHLYAPLRGIFGPNSVNVARYASLIGTKSPTKWDAQLTESNFQTRSGPGSNDTTGMCEDSPFPYSFWYGKIGR